ncbi:MAG: GAF domain-containing sensor histidine kinase [Solirubrobacteraceae bacterium]
MTDVRFVADEQAALRRVATLVARGAPRQAVFDAVCEETGRLLDATNVNLAHFSPEGLNVTMAGWSVRGNHVPTGTRLPLEGETINVIIRRTGAPARVDSYEGVEGELAALLRRLGVRCEVGAPVVVDGAVWGGLIAGSDELGQFPAGSEERVASFAELIGTAVSNATARAELLASRARIVAAADEGRRRLARDLHDGAQQRFVNAAISLQLARQRWATDPGGAREYLDRGLEETQAGIAELRELAAGMHPSILTNRGLRAAAEALADTSALSVSVDAPAARYDPGVEAAVYFVIAEALTNVVKHARASRAEVCVREDGGNLVVDVADDGVGGAALGAHGLGGLRDRVEALGGALTVSSPPGAGTTVHAAVPTGVFPSDRSPSAV